MKRKFFYTIASMVVWFAACTVEGTYTGTMPEPSPQAEPMILTMQGTGAKTIKMAGTGAISINWGDGPKDYLLSLAVQNFSYTYSGNPDVRTVTITGENITHLDCSNIEILSLDITKNTALKELKCRFNEIRSLDVTKNTALTELWCDNNRLQALNLSNNIALKTIHVYYNDLTANSLNALFETLHNKDISGKTIYITKNPGTVECNKNLAETRGWNVDVDTGWGQ